MSGDSPHDGRGDTSDQETPQFRRALTYFDVTNITVGAIVGADIYIAAALTAGILGPASLLAWAAAAVLATVLALTLARCATFVPEVGGPFAYVSRAYGAFPGFLAGWSMWVAELMALPVFAIAFTNYLGYFVDLNNPETHAIRVGFLVTLTLFNVVSVRFAGRLNDVLTLLKLMPLLLLVIGGLIFIAFHFGDARDNLTPFAPFGLGHFSQALVLVFWAYAGFELSTVPSGEVQNPRKTIPAALATGMFIVAAFYLSTNTVLYALVPHEELAASGTPLVAAATLVFGSIGATIVAAGAMVSVSGSDESDMLGASRLGYAMAAEGLLPHALASVHKRFRTPYVALIFQCVLAIGLSFVDRISSLISFAVFNLSFAFLLCALALFRLQGSSTQRPSFLNRLLPIGGVVVAAGLLALTPLQDKIIGCGVLALGALVFSIAAPRETLPHAREFLTDIERQLARLARTRRRFLGGLVALIGRHPPPSSNSP